LCLRRCEEICRDLRRVSLRTEVGEFACLGAEHSGSKRMFAVVAGRDSGEQLIDNALGEEAALRRGPDENISRLCFGKRGQPKLTTRKSREERTQRREQGRGFLAHHEHDPHGRGMKIESVIGFGSVFDSRCDARGRAIGDELREFLEETIAMTPGGCVPVACFKRVLELIEHDDRSDDALASVPPASAGAVKCFPERIGGPRFRANERPCEGRGIDGFEDLATQRPLLGPAVPVDRDWHRQPVGAE
jgi:hypothetical protein